MGRPTKSCDCGCGGTTTRSYIRGHAPKRPMADRFWEKVDKTTGHIAARMESECWLWTASKTTVGYGKFAIDKVGRKAVLRDAHRVSWELANGPIPDGLWILHRCDVRACVRPDHLFLGDARDNNVDMYTKSLPKRQDRSHCANGHTLDSANTAWLRGKTGVVKICRVCQRIANKKSYRRRVQPKS